MCGVYRTTNFLAQRAVLFDFTASRAGEHPRRVLQGFGGTLVSDDYSRYFGLQAQGVTASLCWAHARRKLFEAHQLNGSQIAGQAVTLIAQLYEIEREARDLQAQQRWQLRQQRAKPVVEALHAWLTGRRQKSVKRPAAPCLAAKRNRFSTSGNVVPCLFFQQRTLPECAREKPRPSFEGQGL
jgi:hypothetical protein